MIEKKKKILYVDMDGVLVDFEREMKRLIKKYPLYETKYKDEPDMIPDIFKDPLPIKGSIEAIKKLYESGKYDMVIATTAPWENISAPSFKRLWIGKYLGKEFYKSMIITHRKDLLCGDYLIDDRMANGASEFKGELLSFGWGYEKQEWNEYRDWDSILKKLL